MAAVGIVGVANLFAYGMGDAHKGGDFGSMSRGNNPIMIIKSMNLSEKQQDALFKITQENREEMYKMRKGKTPMNMSSYIKEGKFDKSAYIKAQSADITKMIQYRADSFEKMYNILNDDQKKEFVKKLESNQDMKRDFGKNAMDKKGCITK